MKWNLFCGILILTFLSSFVAARDTGDISGRVADNSGTALSYVNVVLLKATDSTNLIKAAYTDDNGQYNFNDLADGEYVLKFILAGYETYTSNKIGMLGKNINMPDIHLSIHRRELKEVSVRALKPFIEVKADKLIVNVENSIVSAGSSALDILARSPGLRVDQDDNISLKGKQGVNVMINGKIQPISSADLANMLKSMPSNLIDKIEIISNPSAKYDAAGTAGIINIILKKDQRMGVNGSVNIGYGQGVYPKEYGGFSLNCRNKKVNIYANYNLSNREGLNNVSFDRQFYTSGIFNGEYNQHNYTTMLFNTNIAAAGMDYNVSSKTTVGLALNGESMYLGSQGYYLAKVLDNYGQEQSYFATNNGATGHWDNYSANLNLKHVFDTSGTELTVDADYVRYWNRNYQDFTTNYFLPDGSIMQNPYLLHADISGLTQIRSLKADYVRPMEDNIRLEAGIKSSLVTSDNQPNFYNRSNGNNVYDSTKSDHFIYYENINAGYINLSEDGKKWSAQLGLRAEQTFANGDEKITGQTFDRSYFQLFPSFAVQQHLNPDNDLGISLSRRIERPGYSMLNPYKFFIDPSTYKQGNPYLLPALSYSVEVSHTFKQRIITTFNYTQTENVITQVIQPSTTQDRVTIQTDVNIARMTYCGLSGSYTLPFYKWWNNVTNINAYYAKYKGNLANTNLDDGAPTFDINTTNRFLLPKDWSAEITFFYQAPQVYGFFHLNEMWMLNAGIQKSLFNKRGTLRINASDIFWQGNSGGSLAFTDYYETFLAKHDTRQVNVSFTYRFGKNTVAPVRKHSSGAEEEMKRAEGGGKA